MSEWLYTKIQRVPKISDEQISAMRHIEPVLQDSKSGMYRRIAGIDKIDARNASFLWNAKPMGRAFTFSVSNVSRIITQHASAVFFKPSLAEVYAWLLVYMPENWRLVHFFCLGETRRIGMSSDVMCECDVMGKEMLFYS